MGTKERTGQTVDPHDTPQCQRHVLSAGHWPDICAYSSTGGEGCVVLQKQSGTAEDSGGLRTLLPPAPCYWVSNLI